MSLTYGEMFAGYGGLGMGVQSVLGGEMKWCAEFDAAPSKILAHHWPDVPNLGDVTKIDWASVPKVDVITGGSPCQDLSHAGKRAGMKAGTRSGLWASMCDAIEIIRPRLVVWENVRGALSAEADSALEQCPGCMGDGGTRGPVLRALGRVLGDLSELGYDANWYGLSASDVGAPHGRFRIFVFATDSSHATDNRQRAREESWQGDQPATDSDRLRHKRPGTARGWRPGLADDSLTPADAGSQRHGRGQDGRALGRVDGSDAGETRERERSREVTGDRDAETATDADDSTIDRQRSRPEPGQGSQAPADTAQPERRDAQPEHLGTTPRSTTEPRERAGTDWGQYAPAINRWEHILGRSAPAPTEPGPKGGQRLSPRFVEWLMGLPEGHVTDVKISRNDQLKALGNGVVPQQAAAATRAWLAHIESERNAA